MGTDPPPTPKASMLSPNLHGRCCFLPQEREREGEKKDRGRRKKEEDGACGGGDKERERQMERQIYRKRERETTEGDRAEMRPVCSKGPWQNRRAGQGRAGKDAGGQP